MATKIVNAKEVKGVSISDLPDGTYRGTWGGYLVDIRIGGVDYEMRTQDGIRTPAAPCSVTIRSGFATVKAI